MTAIATPLASPSRFAPATAALRTETGLARLALGAVALHAVDDAWLQPNPGTSAADHLFGGLVPLVLLSVAAVLYPWLRAGSRAVVALLAGFFGVLSGVEAVAYLRDGGLSGDDYTGLVSIPAGLVLLGLGAWTLWRSRRRDDSPWWRWTRRALWLGVTFVVASAVLFPTVIAYTVTHVLRGHVPEAELGVPYEDVSFTTSDGLRLEGWYIPSKNGAAVISFPGRTASQERARMLARHGYGVLLFDRRGEGASEGDPNLFGWQGERDVHAAVAFLQARPDVDPQRIGGIGLSVGGEIMIEASAESAALKAIVSEGGSGRSVRDTFANPDREWLDVIGNGFASTATALFTGNVPPAALRDLVPKMHAAAFFIYGENGQPVEEPANRAFYEKAPGYAELWEVPGSGHMGGAKAQPDEYERRLVAFFDRTLLQ